MCKAQTFDLSNLADVKALLKENDEVQLEQSAEAAEQAKERIYKTIAKTAVVTLVAYMLGMDEKVLYSHYGENNGELIETLKNNKEATVIRYLCRLRTTNMLNFKEIDDKIYYDFGNIDRIDYFNKKEIQQLQKWDIPVVQINYRADKYTEHFCTLILENIDKCRGLFPEWINFEYIKDLFVVPKHKKPGVLKGEYTKYKSFINMYPFNMYMYWKPEDCGNILYSDSKFLSLIYSWHKDQFKDLSKIKDASTDTKQNIYDYIDQSQKTVIVVDCENSDVYKLTGVLKNLDADELAKIEKIILFDDYHTTSGWDWLEKYTHIPVEHIEVDRVMDNKSLVDIRMAMGISKAYYEDKVDSFILCSSDSDFWGVISSLPNANFLVLYEYEKCGHAIKDALTLRSIYHCSIDDFYTGNANDIKMLVLRKELEKEIPNILGENAWEVTKRIFWNAKVSATEGEKKQFFEKFVKTLKLKINEDGEFYIDMIA